MNDIDATIDAVFAAGALDDDALTLPAGTAWIDRPCPLCAKTPMVEFFRESNIPTNSCLLLETAAEATSFPTGQMVLAFCTRCGFCSNTAFEPALAEYSQRYEETQAFSKHFTDFGQELAARWVADYGLAGKTVLEIGCGKGEFLTWMVEAGAGHGIGIDPGVHPERIESDATERLTWIADFYDEQSAARFEPDAIVCRHTLEHIQPVGEFMRSLRRSLGDRTHVPVLFELPDVLRVIEETAFWDIYYEHCTYFSLGSLARLFRASGFEVVDVRAEYDDQYLVIAAYPSTTPAQGDPHEVEHDMDRLWQGVCDFSDAYAALRAKWVDRFSEVAARGGRSVIWGGGSKGVAFLTNLGLGPLVDAAVDINPYKTGRFIAGAGHEVLAPAQLIAQPPDLVVVMNPVYVDEVKAELRRLGIDAEVDAV